MVRAASLCNVRTQLLLKRCLNAESLRICNRESFSPSTETLEMVSACLNGAQGAT
jgi:hypothetical protein